MEEEEEEEEEKSQCERKESKCLKDQRTLPLTRKKVVEPRE